MEFGSGDRRASFGPAKQATVLAALLVDAGTALSPPLLIDRVWGNDPPAQARETLHSHIARIRALLTALPTAGVRLTRRSGGYVLEVNRAQIDLFEFRQLWDIARAGQSDAEERVAMLRRALDLWRGEALDGISGAWADEVRASLHQQRLGAYALWSRLELERDNPSVVIEELSGIVARHPLVEPLVATLIRALCLAGRPAEALGCYAQTRRLLAEELGTEPGPELRHVHEAALRGELRPNAGVPVTIAPVPVPQQLPSDVTAFTGRQDELAQLDGLLDPAAHGTGTPAVMVISGTAGVGKTAMALHWAHRVAAELPDGQLYVDLRGFDPDQPLPASEAAGGFLRALGVPAAAVPADPTERGALLRTVLAGRRMLIVLDNAADTEQVRPLLPGARGAVVVVTSRDHLTELVVRHGAHRLVLERMLPEEALRLLGTLAGHRIESDHPAAVAIAERCAHLPLALRIAAEYLVAHPHVSAGQLAGYLADEQYALDVLDAGGSTRTAVRSVFSWSYRNLDGEVARAFRLIGVPTGASIDAQAVAALLDASVATARRALVQLTRAHLLHECAPGQYATHDLLRSYARECLAADGIDERGAAAVRLLDHYVANAAAAMVTMFPAERARLPHVSGLDLGEGPAGRYRVPMPDAAQARTWLDANRDNLVAAAKLAHDIKSPAHAIGLSIALAQYFEIGGHYSQALDIHRWALASARQTGDPIAQAAGHDAIARIYGRYGRFEEALAEAHRALDLRASGGDHSAGSAPASARTLSSIGAFNWMLRRYDESSRYLGQALDVATRAGDYLTAASAASNLAGLHDCWGNLGEAIEFGQRAVKLFDEVGDRVGLGLALGNLGLAYQTLGRYTEALDHFERALVMFHDSDAPAFEARAVNSIACVVRELGRDAEARDHGRRALAMVREILDEDGECMVLDDLGLTYQRLGDHEQAARSHGSALDLAIRTGDRSREASAILGLGEVLAATGLPHEAQTHYSAAIAIAQGIEEPLLEARGHADLAEAAADSGDHVRAREHWLRSLRIYEKVASPKADALRRRLAELGRVD